MSDDCLAQLIDTCGGHLDTPCSNETALFIATKLSEFEHADPLPKLHEALRAFPDAVVMEVFKQCQESHEPPTGGMIFWLGRELTFAIELVIDHAREVLRHRRASVDHPS
jgi:hypothetical protein